MAGEGRQHEGDSYPMWEVTDWSPQQRVIAIQSLLLLAFACSVILVALLRWESQPLAQTICAPIGMTLLTLGAARLSQVFWYTYIHARNRIGKYGEMGTAGVNVVTFTAVMALANLGLQLVAAVITLTEGWSGWDSYGPYSFLMVSGVYLLLSAMLSIVQTTRSWRPSRDPTATGSALDTPVTGARLGLRWVVMLVAQNTWALICGAMYALNIWDSGLSIRAQSILFGAVGLFFLVAALAEWTHADRAEAPPPVAS